MLKVTGFKAGCYSKAFLFSSEGEWWAFHRLCVLELRGKGEMWSCLFELEKWE